MEEKLRFVFEYERDEQTMTELCARKGKLTAKAAGLAGLAKLAGLVAIDYGSLKSREGAAFPRSNSENCAESNLNE